MGILTELLVPLQPLTGDLSKLSTPVFVAVATAAFIVLSVVLNVVQQIVFKDKGKPPVVFHFFPFFGSTVVYGMDPYAFFASNQEKVRSARSIHVLQLRNANPHGSTAMSSPSFFSERR
jgi:hypothetical protein